MEDLIKYFCNLLIIQYRNKVKASATIKALVKTLFEDVEGNVFLLKYQDAFDLDTADDAQLQVLAKYIGAYDTLSVPQTNYFKLSDTEGQDETPGLSDVFDTYTGYPLLSYSGYNYVIQSIVGVAGIDVFRNILKFLTEMKNETLSSGNLDRTLYKYFQDSLFVEEGNKSIKYIYTDEILDKFSRDTSLLETTIKNTMPKPMGCSLSIEPAPYYLNLVSVGGLTVNEDFIYVRDEDYFENDKYFELPYDIDIAATDAFELGMKVKIYRDYGQAGFVRTSEPTDRFSFFNLDRNFAATGFERYFQIYSSTDLTNKWLNFVFQKTTPGGALFVKIVDNGQIVADNIQVPMMFYYTGKMQFGVGYTVSGNVGFNGEIDFKECYMKKNNEVIWRGVTNIKGGLNGNR
ncbi:MAG: DUF2612 domain-containing protein [Clostridia bacterium]|nr:DUF2612 domain-containing protein [Clostridia bacterium]